MKKLVFFVCLGLLVIVFAIIPRNNFNKNGEIDYKLIPEKEAVYIYFFEKEELVGVPITNISEDKYNRIVEAFEYITSKSNSVSSKYQTKLNLSTTLLSYELQRNDLYLDVSDDFFRIAEENYTMALGQILYTYRDLGYDNIYLTNDGKIINQLGSNLLDQGIKNNLPLNVSILSNSTYTKTIKVEYIYSDDVKTFRNYLVNIQTKEMEFIIEKLIDFLNINYDANINVKEIHFRNNTLTIEFEDLNFNKSSLLKLLKINVDVTEDNIYLI